MREKYIALFNNLLKVLGNTEAALMCYDYFIVAQYWDDLIDRDCDLTDSEIHDAFITMSIKIPSNPFFIANRERLLPVIETTIYKWLKANEYESNERELHKSYMLRAGIYDLFSICYTTLHGIGGIINIYDLYGETFEDFEKEIKCQTQP